MEDIRKRLEVCYTGVVHDVMRGRGLRNFTFPQELRPLIDDQVLCGPAFTIEGHVDDTADPHQTLVEWTGLLSKAPAGHIWVSQPNDRTIAQMGELSAETLQAKGVLGCVIDGGIRDAGFLKRLGFQCWRRFHTPRDVVGRWLPSRIEVPVIIGDVVINPGDFLLGDEDGMVRVPRGIADEVSKAAWEAMQTENKVRTAILAGQDPQAAYLQFGKF